MAHYATQGGGTAVLDENGTLIWKTPPEWLDAEVGDRVPPEWSVTGPFDEHTNSPL